LHVNKRAHPKKKKKEIGAHITKIPAVSSARKKARGGGLAGLTGTSTGGQGPKPEKRIDQEKIKKGAGKGCFAVKMEDGTGLQEKGG